jgi:hypothetical protein
VFKGLAISHVIYNDDSMCAAVVAACECSESFLSSCVPLSMTKSTYNLHLDDFFVQFDVFDFLEMKVLTKSTPIVLKKFSVKEFSCTLEIQSEGKKME